MITDSPVSPKVLQKHVTICIGCYSRSILSCLKLGTCGWETKSCGKDTHPRLYIIVLGCAELCHIVHSTHQLSCDHSVEPVSFLLSVWGMKMICKQWWYQRTRCKYINLYSFNAERTILIMTFHEYSLKDLNQQRQMVGINQVNFLTKQYISWTKLISVESGNSIIRLIWVSSK